MVTIFSLKLRKLTLFQGCHGTTRLPGAGTVVRKDGALFGPHTVYADKTRAKSTSPKRATLNESTGKFEYRDRTKPAVPKRDEKPILGIQSNKNFVTTNAVEAILMGIISSSLIFEVC